MTLLSTYCRLCNKEIAQAPELHIPLEGQPDWNGLQYLMLLQKHLKKRHPEHAAALEVATMEFGGMLLANHYQIQDQSVTARAELFRDSLINQFAVQISDEQLDLTIDRVMSGNESGEKILHREQAQQITRALRDLFTCRGEYAPKSEALKEAPALVTP